MKLDEVNLGNEGRWRRVLKPEPWDLQPLGVGEMRRSQQRRLKGEAREAGGTQAPQRRFLYKELHDNFFFWNKKQIVSVDKYI